VTPTRAPFSASLVEYRQDRLDSSLDFADWGLNTVRAPQKLGNRMDLALQDVIPAVPRIDSTSLIVIK
jgi:hypothetical protein